MSRKFKKQPTAQKYRLKDVEKQVLDLKLWKERIKVFNFGIWLSPRKLLNSRLFKNFKLKI